MIKFNFTNSIQLKVEFLSLTFLISWKKFYISYEMFLMLSKLT